jgi:hypothetical protein
MAGTSLDKPSHDDVVDRPYLNKIAAIRSF